MVERKNSLPNVMAETSREIVGRIKNLAEGVSIEINNGSAFSPVEIAAALGMIAKLSEAEASILERSARIIFADGASPIANTEKLGENKHPYNNLLRLKIEQELIPQGETTFTKNRLLEVIERFKLGETKLNKIFGGFPEEKLSREQAISIIAEVLKTPLREKRSEKSESTRHQTYDKGYLSNHCRITAKQLDNWAEEADHNWKTNKTVGKEEADAIYGLSRLEKSKK